MPWYIHTAEFVGKAPNLHLSDLTVDLHMVTNLHSGVVDLYIGDVEPSKAAIRVTIDVRRTPILRLDRAEAPTSKQCSIINSVLETMGIEEGPRRYILSEARRQVRQ